MSAAADWPGEWLAFELLRRLPAYQAAWADYLSNRAEDPHGWGVALAAIGVAHAKDADATRRDGPDMQSQKWSSAFGLQYMLDPTLNAETHGHIPWRPGSAALPIAVVRGPESFVFDPSSNPYWRRGHRRFVPLGFDLGLPIKPQLAEAEELLTKLAGNPASATRGRHNATIVRHLAVLDLDADGATNEQIGRQFSANKDTSTHAGYGAKLVQRARELQATYRAVASGTMGPRVDK